MRPSSSAGVEDASALALIVCGKPATNVAVIPATRLWIRLDAPAPLPTYRQLEPFEGGNRMATVEKDRTTQRDNGPPPERGPRGEIAREGSDSYALVAAVSVLLGVLVAVLGLFSIFMWSDAHDAKNAAKRAAAKVAAAPALNGQISMATGLESYAGAAPANADALAAAHSAFPASLPPAPAGPIADANLVLKDAT